VLIILRRRPRMTEDKKDFEEWENNTFLIYNDLRLARKQAFLAGRRSLREKEAKNQLVLPDGCLPRPEKELLDILEFAEGTIMDAILSEDGLDGDAGMRVLKMISDSLVKYGRISSFTQIPKEEV